MQTQTRMQDLLQDILHQKIVNLQYVEKITTILTNPSFLLKFSTTRFRYVSAYYQVMFNTDE